MRPSWRGTGGIVRRLVRHSGACWRVLGRREWLELRVLRGLLERVEVLALPALLGVRERRGVSVLLVLE